MKDEAFVPLAPLTDDDAERRLVAYLAALQAEYARRAEPIMQQLAYIRSLRAPAPIFIAEDSAEIFRLHLSALAPT